MQKLSHRKGTHQVGGVRAQAHAPDRDAALCFSVFSLAAQRCSTPKPASSLFYSSKDFIAKTSSLSFLLLVSNCFVCSHRRMKMRVDKLLCGWGSSCSTQESGPALGLDSTGELALLQRCEWTCSENISLGELAGPVPDQVQHLTWGRGLPRGIKTGEPALLLALCCIGWSRWG